MPVHGGGEPGGQAERIYLVRSESFEPAPSFSADELAAEGTIGSAADFHYSFMGAGSSVARYEPKARELAGLLKKDHVDAVLLTPV